MEEVSGDTRHLLFEMLKEVSIEMMDSDSIQIICKYFDNDIEEFEQAIFNKWSFINIGISGLLDFYIYSWFTIVKDIYVMDNSENLKKWYALKANKNKSILD